MFDALSKGMEFNLKLGIVALSFYIPASCCAKCRL
jgi:hypothetical protein